MKFKIMLAITVLAFSVSAIMGYSTRASFTDINAEDDSLSQFHVALASDKTVEIQTEFMNEVLFESEFYELSDEEIALLNDEELFEYEELQSTSINYILRVKPVADMELSYNTSSQMVVVFEVYKGEGINIGDRLDIVFGWSVNLDEDRSGSSTYNTVNMGFINELSQDEEYLVFLNAKIDSPDSSDMVFTTPNFTINTIFCYSDIENSIPELESSLESYVSYKKVENNEFFVQSEYGLSLLNDLKWKLLELYPN